MRIAIYVRVSTDEQAEEGYSISAQRDRLSAYCVSQGWDIVETYIDDGESAKNLDRKELKRLISDAESGMFDVVLVYRLDRLTRTVMDLYTILQTFEKHNVKFKSATEVYDTTTAMGRLFLTLVAALAQWERENLGERVRFGMEQMVREGKRPGGPVPFGYDNDGRIIPEEAEIVRKLRRLYMDGHGFRVISIKLNEMGLFRRGYQWGQNTVSYTLGNPYYAGKIRWGEKMPNGKYATSTRKKEEFVELHDSDHEKIFTYEEYEEHTARMKRRSFRGYTKLREYWFSGILRCAKCGSSMSGRYHQNKRKDGSYKRILSYICANRQDGKGCTMPMFRQELVEHLIMEYIHKIKLDSEQVEKASKVSLKKSEDKIKSINKLKAELNRVHERKKKWQYMFVEDLITEDDLRKRKLEEEENEKSIQTSLRELLHEEKTKDTEIQLLLDLPVIWNRLEDIEKSELIQTIFFEIELYTPLERAQGKKGQFIPASITRVQYN